MVSSSLAQHPKHEDFERIASRIEDAATIDAVAWREAKEFLSDGLSVALHVENPPAGSDGFVLEVEFKVENVTRGYSWQLTKRFEFKGSAIRATIMEHDLPEGKEISGEDQLEPQVISCRADS